MKKLLCTLFALTLILTSCTTPTSTQSTPTASSDISSLQAENVLSDYANSQEALDFVKRIAPFTAEISYSSIDYVDSFEKPWQLIYAIFEEISAVGTSASDVPLGLVELETAKVCELLTKYFGSSAVPTLYAQKRGTESFLRKTADFFTVQSVELSEFSGKEAVYKVNLKHISFDYNYVAQMRFLVLNENNETWLQLISNALSVKNKLEFTLEEKAVALTTILVPSIESTSYENDYITSKDITNNVIFRFLLGVANRNYCEDLIYCHSFEKDFSLQYHFPQETISKIAYEVFGEEDYEFETDNNFTYNESHDEYISALEFGGHGLEEDIVEVTTLSDLTITVKVQGVRKVQTLQFKPMQDESGRTFLRLI